MGKIPLVWVLLVKVSLEALVFLVVLVVVG
jgi:hypothetical protein